MIILKESGRAIESYSIQGKGTKDAAILAILANSKVTISDSNLLQVEIFLGRCFEGGVPITETYITPNGFEDVGEVVGLLDHKIMVDRKPMYDFPVTAANKIYRIDFNKSTGFFILGDRVSVYLRNY